MDKDYTAIKQIRADEECGLYEAKRKWVKRELKRRIAIASTLDDLMEIVADIIDEAI